MDGGGPGFDVIGALTNGLQNQAEGAVMACVGIVALVLGVRLAIGIIKKFARA